MTDVDRVRAAPIPSPDGVDAPFWHGTLAGELRVQRCGDCGTTRFPPEWFCAECGSAAITWLPTDGRGRIRSWTRARVRPGADENTLLVLVSLVQWPNIAFFGNIAGSQVLDPVMDEPVVAQFRRVGEHAVVEWHIPNSRRQR